MLTFLAAVLLLLRLLEGVVCVDLRDGVGDFDKLDIADTLQSTSSSASSK